MIKICNKRCGREQRSILLPVLGVPDELPSLLSERTVGVVLHEPSRQREKVFAGRLVFKRFIKDAESFGQNVRKRKLLGGRPSKKSCLSGKLRKEWNRRGQRTSLQRGKTHGGQRKRWLFAVAVVAAVGAA